MSYAAKQYIVSPLLAGRGFQPKPPFPPKTNIDAKKIRYMKNNYFSKIFIFMEPLNLRFEDDPYKGYCKKKLTFYIFSFSYLIS